MAEKMYLFDMTYDLDEDLHIGCWEIMTPDERDNKIKRLEKIIDAGYGDHYFRVDWNENEFEEVKPNTILNILDDEYRILTEADAEVLLRLFGKMFGPTSIEEYISAIEKQIAAGVVKLSNDEEDFNESAGRND